MQMLISLFCVELYLFIALLAALNLLMQTLHFSCILNEATVVLLNPLMFSAANLLLKIAVSF